MFFYRAVLPLSTKTVNYVAGIIRRYLKELGSRWRKLNPARQPLLVLAYLRKGETFTDLAAGFGVGATTAWRSVNETVDLLAAWAPKLRKAVRDAKKKGYAYVVVDGTLSSGDLRGFPEPEEPEPGRGSELAAEDAAERGIVFSSVQGSCGRFEAADRSL